MNKNYLNIMSMLVSIGIILDIMHNNLNHKFMIIPIVLIIITGMLNICNNVQKYSVIENYTEETFDKYRMQSFEKENDFITKFFTPQTAESISFNDLHTLTLRNILKPEFIEFMQNYHEPEFVKKYLVLVMVHMGMWFKLPSIVYDSNIHLVLNSEKNFFSSVELNTIQLENIEPYFSIVNQFPKHTEETLEDFLFLGEDYSNHGKDSNFNVYTAQFQAPKNLDLWLNIKLNPIIIENMVNIDNILNTTFNLKIITIPVKSVPNSGGNSMRIPRWYEFLSKYGTDKKNDVSMIEKVQETNFSKTFEEIKQQNQKFEESLRQTVAEPTVAEPTVTGQPTVAEPTVTGQPTVAEPQTTPQPTVAHTNVGGSNPTCSTNNPNKEWKPLGKYIDTTPKNDGEGFVANSDFPFCTKINCSDILLQKSCKSCSTLGKNFAFVNDFDSDRRYLQKYPEIKMV